MTRSFVADASVAIGWVHPSRSTADTAATQIALGWIRGLRLRIDHEAAGVAFSRLSELASACQLSVYDAAYLELAQRRSLPLACRDEPLRKAAKKCGVALYSVG